MTAEEASALDLAQAVHVVGSGLRFVAYLIFSEFFSRQIRSAVQDRFGRNANSGGPKECEFVRGYARTHTQ